MLWWVLFTFTPQSPIARMKADDRSQSWERCPAAALREAPERQVLDSNRGKSAQALKTPSGQEMATERQGMPSKAGSLGLSCGRATKTADLHYLQARGVFSVPMISPTKFMPTTVANPRVARGGRLLGMATGKESHAA